MGALEDAFALFVDARLAAPLALLEGDVNDLAARVAALEAALPPEPPPEPDPEPEPEPSARRLAVWCSARSILLATDAELDEWATERGTGAFAVQTGRLSGLGRTALENDNIAALETERVVERCAERGIEVYLGCYLHATSPVHPFVDWFDDAAWASKVVPALTEFAAYAKQQGAVGLAIDGELPAGELWGADYGSQSAAAVHAKAGQRGREFMQALTAGFPDLELVVYHFKFPGSLEEAWRQKLGRPAGYDASKMLYGDFWEGGRLAGGYGRIEFLDNEFYKSLNHPDFRTWDSAVAEATRRFYEFWGSVDRDRWQYTAFIWIPHGPGALAQLRGGLSATAWDRALHPAVVREQLLAARDHGTARSVAVYSPKLGPDYEPPFDWAPYVPALREIGG